MTLNLFSNNNNLIENRIELIGLFIIYFKVQFTSFYDTIIKCIKIKELFERFI